MNYKKIYESKKLKESISVLDFVTKKGLANTKTWFGSLISRPAKDFYNYTRTKGWFGGLGWETPADEDELEKDWENWTNSLIEVSKNTGDWEGVEKGATCLYLEDKNGIGCMGWEENGGYAVYDLYGYEITKVKDIEEAKKAMLKYYFDDYTKDTYHQELNLAESKESPNALENIVSDFFTDFDARTAGIAVLGGKNE